MILDLEQKSGLKLSFDDQNFQLVFEDPNIVLERFDIRTKRALAPFIKNKNAKSSRENIYYTYRNLIRKSDEEIINSANLRYDITLIPPGSFVYKNQKELARTAGHYHEIKAGTGLGFPEVYEVVYGKATWLMQKPEESDYAKLSKIYLVDAEAGEKAVMLPGFGHISINTTGEPLILANWIGNNFKYNYEPYKKYRGGGYWIQEDETGKVIFEKNMNYSRVPELKKLKPRELPEFGFYKTEPIYRLIHDFPRLRFLLFPEEFEGKLTADYCYEEL